VLYAKKQIILKLALQRLEVSISQRITDGIRESQLLPCWHTEHGCRDELLMSGNLGIKEVATPDSPS
jgi:hypothetical protein